MATVMYIREQKQSVAAMKGVLTYCCRDDKVYDNDGNRYVSGVNCDGENSFTEFMTTKNAFDKTDGMNFYQYVQSFSPEENISPRMAHEIALAFANEAWQGHEILVTTHCDAGHLHSHFVINSVSFETGNKLRQHPDTLKKLRELSDRICKENDLNVLKPYENDGAKISAREYRAADKGESWKFQLMITIDNAMKRCGSRREFVEEMHRHGYEVLWMDTRKYITFTCPNGMKCRGIKLHDKKYMKENIENELRTRQQILGRQAQGEQSGGAHRAGERAVSPGGLRSDGESARELDGAAHAGCGVSTGAVQPDSNTCNTRATRETPEGNSEYPNRFHEQDGRGADDDQQRLSPRVAESSATDARELKTGWEESRRIYFENLRRNGQEDNSARLGDIRSAPQNPANYVRHGGGLGAAVTRGLSSASRIIDDTAEEPEERRKRIEAEQNGSDLGALIGLAVGVAAELLQAEETTEEQTMQ